MGIRAFSRKSCGRGGPRTRRGEEVMDLVCSTYIFITTIILVEDENDAGSLNA
jgi:hypothetical protein